MSYLFQRGETVTLALAVVSGDPALVADVTAAMKPVTAGRSGVDRTVPVAATFEVAFEAAHGDEPARWLLTLAPTVSAGLAAGSYLADARLIVGGGVAITETIGLTIREAVTS